MTQALNGCVCVIAIAAVRGEILTGTTVKLTPALATPSTVIITLPVVAPAGTGDTIEVALQPVGVAAAPLKVSLLLPWVAPKFVPVIVIGAPAALDAGETLVMTGVGGGGRIIMLLPPPPQPARARVAARAAVRRLNLGPSIVILVAIKSIERETITAGRPL